MAKPATARKPRSVLVPDNETKEDKFVRLGDKRVSAALQKIRLIGNLSGPGYNYTQAQVELIEGVLREAVVSTMARFHPTEEAGAPTFTLRGA